MAEFEMKDLNPNETEEEEQERLEQEEEGETSFTAADLEDVELNDSDLKERVAARPSRYKNEPAKAFKERITQWLGKEMTREKRSATVKRKKFFKEKMKMVVVARDGGASKTLITKSILSIDKKTGEPDGIIFDGVKVVVRNVNDGKFMLNKGTGTINAKINEFDELLEKAAIEHGKTATGFIEKNLKLSPEAAELLRRAVANDMQDDIIIMGDAIFAKASELEGENDINLKNLTGVLNVKGKQVGVSKEVAEANIAAVDINRKLYTDKANAEKNPKLKALYQAIADGCSLKLEQLRVDLNKAPEMEETEERLENHVLTKFERFKEWAKENMGVTAAVAISIAGIITTVVIAGKQGVVTAAKATGALGKAVAKLGKAVLPALVPLVNLLVAALSWGAKGLAWLAKNLWVLAIGLTYILYKEYKERYKK